MSEQMGRYHAFIAIAVIVLLVVMAWAIADHFRCRAWDTSFLDTEAIEWYTCDENGKPIKDPEQWVTVHSSEYERRFGTK